MWTSNSSTSTSSTSSSSFTNNNNNNALTTTDHQTVPKSMEEVWRDIGGLNPHPHPHPTRGGGVILQDFFSRDIPPKYSTPLPPPLYGTPPPLPQPTINLTLSSVVNVPDHHFNSMLGQQPHHQYHPISQICNPLLLDENAGGGGGKKRFLQPEFDKKSGGGDRRHKRMIKNRESAARSRARKQEIICLLDLSAYTNELELEVANLLEENAKLKKQQQQLYLAAAAQPQRKKSLHRSSTAPF